MSKVVRSSVINTSIDNVWWKIRDFKTLSDWHPAFFDCYVENGEPGDRIGAIRNFNITSGGNIRERLLAMNDKDYLYTYTIVHSPLPVKDYMSTIRLLPVSDGGRTYIEWTAEFNCLASDEESLLNTIGGIFQAGFNSLKEKLERR